MTARERNPVQKVGQDVKCAAKLFQDGPYYTTNSNMLGLRGNWDTSQLLNLEIYIQITNTIVELSI